MLIDCKFPESAYVHSYLRAFELRGKRGAASARLSILRAAAINYFNDDNPASTVGKAFSRTSLGNSTPEMYNTSPVQAGSTFARAILQSRDATGASREKTPDSTARQFCRTCVRASRSTAILRAPCPRSLRHLRKPRRTFRLISIRRTGITSPRPDARASVYIIRERPRTCCSYMRTHMFCSLKPLTPGSLFLGAAVGRETV